ncbi:UDP-N-acetylmuramyl-tripeptide synthetase [Patescibacteria group bacterium]|nr:UDP-N-acetylmuramyl-tripeptide synthetase [Patescibacteria group bacterium]
MSIKSAIKKIIPRSAIRYYHLCLAYIANIIYGFPSKKMVVIGVTGTNGKTSTCNMIARTLEDAGKRVGMATTINFKIAEKEWINTYKQSMLGRFKLQKLLKQMLDAKCEYAIIETTSQGIEQFRSFGINYDICIFTNITPEHIEAHHGFENYKKAKLKLFKQLENRKEKIINGKYQDRVIIANFDDEHVLEFINFNVNKIIGIAADRSKYKTGTSFDVKDSNIILNFINDKRYKFFKAENIDIGFGYTRFIVNNVNFNLKLTGLFNVYNSLFCIATCDVLSIDINLVKQSLEKIENILGRMQFVENSKNIIGIVDYAHDPNSIRSVYENIINIKNADQKIIAVLGSCGGGRDEKSRFQKGENAGKDCDYVIITNEDPYDDDPEKIIDDVFKGVISCSSKKENENCFKILDRREAIKKAVELASSRDIIICTGKGAEKAIMFKNGKKMDWDEVKVLQEEINNKI